MLSLICLMLSQYYVFVICYYYNGTMWVQLRLFDLIEMWMCFWETWLFPLTFPLMGPCKNILFLFIKASFLGVFSNWKSSLFEFWVFQMLQEIMMIRIYWRKLIDWFRIDVQVRADKKKGIDKRTGLSRQKDTSKTLEDQVSHEASDSIE